MKLTQTFVVARHLEEGKHFLNVIQVLADSPFPLSPEAYLNILRFNNFFPFRIFAGLPFIFFLSFIAK